MKGLQIFLVLMTSMSQMDAFSTFTIPPTANLHSKSLFGVIIPNRHIPCTTSRTTTLNMIGTGDDEDASLDKLDDSESEVPTPFVDPETGSFIECFIDSVATVKGLKYSIGVPCDYSVALCYFDKDGELNPVDLEDHDLMSDVFPVAESIVEEEFGEELALMRTPQTLTLVGELELGEDDDEYEFDTDEMQDEEEEVEILLSFDHDGKEFNLVRLLDPVLLVARADEGNLQTRILLSPRESDEVMPYIEEMILDYQEEIDSKAS